MMKPKAEARTGVVVDEDLARMRAGLAEFTADTFTQAGGQLHAVGHIIGTDRLNGDSPGGHGSDEVVGISLLLRIGGELVAAITGLLAQERQYAAAALLRQMVEIEYLAWAFETRDKDAERWLRSTPEERRKFFKPAKLRQASSGRFPGKAYRCHCEFGGHPVPRSSILLKKDEAIGQLLLCDLLAHTGQTWNHIVRWAEADPLGRWLFAGQLAESHEEMRRRYTQWKAADTLIRPSR